MRDRKPTVVDQIAVDLATVRWMEAAEIRARARRRTRRRVAGAAVALLLVVGASTVALNPAFDAVPHSGAAPPPRAEIPVEALLRPADLSERPDLPLTESGVGEPVRVDPRLAACRQAQGLPAGWETSLWSRSQTLLRNRPDGSGDPPGDVLVSQDLYRVAPPVAARFFTNLDALVAACAAWRSVDPGPDRTDDVQSWTLAERGFAGDEAALLRHLVAPPRDQAGGMPGPAEVAIVRVGDLVTVITPGRSVTEGELLRLGRIAATRMCLAANPSC